MKTAWFIGILMLVFEIAFACCALAVEPFVAPNVSKTQSVKIDSGKMKLVTDRQKIFLYDNVEVTQVNSKFFADEMILIYDNVLNGSLNKESTQLLKIEAYGNVKFKSDNLTAVGKTGFYDVKKDECEIDGDVVVNEKGVLMNGDRFIYNTKTKEIKLFGNKKNDDRVGIILENVSEIEQRIEETKKQ